jgi:TolB protein
MPAPSDGGMAAVVEVSGILAGKGGPSILVNERVMPSLLAWQQDVLDASGWGFLHETLGSWRNIDSVRKKAMYAYDYGFLSWHKTGRALDLALEFKVDGEDQLLLVREDLGESVFWRLYLRAAKQDGTQGEPLRDNPWLRWWWIVPSEDPEAYEAGGKRLPIPSGYYVDLTALAKRHGWERIASYAIEDDYHWKTDTNGTEYWHYERTDGLTWWEAMSQIYEPETLGENVGWAVGLQSAQTEEMMRSKGVPAPGP